MPTWLIPALKAVIPHLGTIVAAAAPVFSAKRAGVAAGRTMTLQQQATELQAAASANDAHIKELAAQIQVIVESLETAHRRYQRILLLCTAAMALSVAAAGAALYMVLAR